MRFHKYKFACRSFQRPELSTHYMKIHFPNSYRWSDCGYLIGLISKSNDNFDYKLDTGYFYIICHVIYSDNYDISISDDELYITVPHNTTLNANDFYFKIEPLIDEIIQKRLYVLKSQNILTLKHDIAEKDNIYEFLKDMLENQFVEQTLNTLSTELYIYQDISRRDYWMTFVDTNTYIKLHEYENFLLEIFYAINDSDLEKYQNYFINPYTQKERQYLIEIIKYQLDIIFRKIFLVINDYLLKTKGEEVC